MKAKLFLIAGVAMIASLASCSKEDVTTPGVITSDMTTAYAKVAISMPKVSSTRADGDNEWGFSNGTADEQAVTEINLAFYDEYGNYVGEGKQVSDNITTEDGAAGQDNVSNKANAVFKLSLIEGAYPPAKVMAFINTGLNKNNISDLTTAGKIGVAATELYTAATEEKKETNFVMTNAGFYKEGEYVVAADLEQPFYDTKEDAEKAESELNATIYVERLAAKITVKKKTTDGGIKQSEVDYVVKDVAGTEVKLEFTPTNWAPTGTAKNENLVKAKFAYTPGTDDVPTTGTGWKNDASRNRSYWAEGYYYNEKFEAYYDSQKGEVAKDAPLNYVTFGELTKEGAIALGAVGDVAQYAPEHTTQLQVNYDEDTGKENIIANTYALIVGNYTLKGEDGTAAYDNQSWFEEGDGTDKTLNFFLLLAGMDEDDNKIYTMYNKSQLIGLLLHYNGIEMVGKENDKEKITQPTVVTDNSFDFTEYLDIEFKKDINKYVLTTKTDGNDLYYMAKADDATPTKVDASDSNLPNSTNSRHYNYANGQAFFNALIPHQIDNDGKNATYGVVRNHHYILRVDAIEALGAPLNGDEYGPNDPIIPDPDDLKDHFIKASIEVLAWHEKENGITLK